tara:strand:- start:1597 stop:2415 length:819 start_codon:yes stop_codon:yes gene_type:complete
MIVTGSKLINTSSTGAPVQFDDRPFSFALGTQIFLNPVDDPTDAIVSFKFDPNLINSFVVSSQAPSFAALGFATDSQLDSISTWTSSYIDTANSELFPVGFARLSSAASKVSVNGEGFQVATLGRSSNATSVSISTDTFTIPNHPFATGDRVKITSTGSIPGGLSTSLSYFIINATDDTIRLALTASNAAAGTSVDLQTTGSGTITVATDEIFTLTRSGTSGSVTLNKGDTVIKTFTNTNTNDPLRLFYWCREQSNSSTLPIFKEIKVQGAL